MRILVDNLGVPWASGVVIAVPAAFGEEKESAMEALPVQVLASLMLVGDRVPPPSQLLRIMPVGRHAKAIAAHPVRVPGMRLGGADVEIVMEFVVWAEAYEMAFPTLTLYKKRLLEIIRSRLPPEVREALSAQGYLKVNLEEWSTDSIITSFREPAGFPYRHEEWHVGTTDFLDHTIISSIREALMPPLPPLPPPTDPVADLTQHMHNLWGDDEWCLDTTEGSFVTPLHGVDAWVVKGVIQPQRCPSPSPLQPPPHTHTTTTTTTTTPCSYVQGCWDETHSRGSQKTIQGYPE